MGAAGWDVSACRMVVSCPPASNNRQDQRTRQIAVSLSLSQPTMNVMHTLMMRMTLGGHTEYEACECLICTQ